MQKRLELSIGDRTVYIDMIGAQFQGTVVGVREKNGKRVYKVRHDYGVAVDINWSNRYLFKEGDVIPEHILEECSPGGNTTEEEEEEIPEQKDPCADGNTTEEEEEIPVLQRENLCANVDDAVEDETPVLKRQVSDDAGSDAPVLKRQRSDE